MCALLTELTESKKQHSECQDEVKTTTASLFTKLIGTLIALKGGLLIPLSNKCSYGYINLKMVIKSKSN